MKGFLNLARLPGQIAKRESLVARTPSDEVFRENKWRLLRYRPRPAGIGHLTPVLLVPSLINRHYVLDLLPHKSFAADLVTRGHDVFVIDWGRPEAEDRFVGFDTFADRYLRRAVGRSLAAAGAGQLHLFGYCLGGTLAAVQAALHPEPIASFVALGTPIRFKDEGLVGAFCRAPGLQVGHLIAALGNLPWPLMQVAFHALRPTLSLAKSVQLLNKAHDDAYLEGVLALETWGNDNVSFPGRAFEEYVRRFYEEDALLEGTLHVGGRRVDLKAIRCPTLAVTFEHDNIVPWESARLLLDKVGGPTEHLHLNGGHVGALVSSAAQKTLWPKLSEFWIRHEASLPRVRRVRSEQAPARDLRT